MGKFSERIWGVLRERGQMSAAPGWRFSACMTLLYYPPGRCPDEDSKSGFPSWSVDFSLIL